MKFTLSWLKDHLETSATLAQVSETLTSIGLEVESITDKAEALKPFLVAEILSASPHPDAAKLQVCAVNTGTETLQIVCGAANARAGIKVVLAPIGTTIPTNGLVIKKAAIRGVESNGMLCSEEELGLATSSEGILELPAAVTVGQPFASQMGLADPVIEINITPDRADCLGVRGIARDLAAAGLGTLKPLAAPGIKGSFASPTTVTLQESGCKQFIGRTITGVTNGPSPAWLQQRLTAIGLRPISVLVDITNYLTFDLGRPAHVFDAAKLKGNIIARRSRAGESLRALNGKDYVLDDKVTVIADESTVVGIGGIIGGETSGCTETTTDVFLEIAYFDPTDIAATGRRYSIDSDARYRFERGADPAFLHTAVDLATQLIQQLCGGEASEVVIAGSAPAWQRTISFDPAYTAKLSGVEVSAPRSKEILEALGFTVDSNWQVIPPSWRRDVEGPADLVEEIIRIDGFDAIPSTPLPRQPQQPNVILPLEQRRASNARRALAARGLLEVQSWSFLHHETAAQFGGQKPELRLINPISSELDTMRPSLLPNLLNMAKRNHERGFDLVALCEVGLTYHALGENGQQMVAAGIRSGSYLPENPHTPSRPVTAFDAKADAFAALEACGGPTTAPLTRDVPEWYHPGRSGVMMLGKTLLARFGELHPALLQQWGIKETVVGFEVFLDAIPAPKTKSKAKPAYQPSDLMSVSRDYSFILSSDTLVAALLKAIEGADKKLIQKAEVISLYQDAAAKTAREASIAIRVTFQPQEATLTEAEIDALSGTLITQALKTPGCRASASLLHYMKDKNLTIA